jgi:DnaJ-class molecular chaperone
VKYLWGERFTVPMGGDAKYRANWDAIFGKKETRPETRRMCPECHGERYVDVDEGRGGTNLGTCPSCDGFGYVTAQTDE